MFFKIFKLVLNIKKLLENKKSYLIAASTIGYGAYQGFIASNGNWKIFANYLISGSFMAATKAAIVKASATSAVQVAQTSVPQFPIASTPAVVTLP